MARKADPKQKIIDAALALIGDEGWRALTLVEIAGEAGVKLPILRTYFATKEAILEAFRARIDAQVLDYAAGEDWQGETPRDRLFDVIMARFDALEPAKPALQRLFAETLRDPMALISGAQGAINSMGWMLEAAKITPIGLRRLVMTRGLAVLYARIMQIWLEDDEPGMPRTMAELDRRLRQAEGLFTRLPGLGFGPERAGEARA